jgi:hypothetical protein
MPDDAPDFACPYGLPWNPTAEQLEAFGAKAAAEQARSSELATANEATCGACEGKPACTVWKLLSPCNRKRALNGDPMYPCPKGLLKVKGE